MRPQPESGTSPPSSAGSARSRPRKGAARGPPEEAPAEASTTALEGALPLAVGRLTAWVVLPAAVVGELGEIVRWVEAQTWDRVWTALQAAGAKERLLTTEVLEALARALDRQWDEVRGYRGEEEEEGQRAERKRKTGGRARVWRRGLRLDSVGRATSSPRPRGSGGAPFVRPGTMSLPRARLRLPRQRSWAAGTERAVIC